MSVQMQARSSSNGQLYTWIVSAAAWDGAGFPGPGSPQDVALSMRPPVEVGTGGGGGGGGGGAQEFSWWLTNKMVHQASDSLLVIMGADSTYDPPSIDTTAALTDIPFTAVSGSIQNNTGGTIKVRARAVFNGNTGSWDWPGFAFCKNGTVPDINDEPAYATNGICRVFMSTEDEFALVAERVVTLADGDTVGPAFWWGSPHESQAPWYSSLLVSYTVIG